MACPRRLTDLDRELRRQFQPWKRDKVKKGYNIKLTTQEFSELWKSSNHWAERGQSVGKYTLYHDPSLKDIYIHDCSIIKRELSPKSRAYKKANPQPRKIKVKAQELYVNKFLLQESMKMNDPSKLTNHFESLDEAIINFYENSPNPLNKKIMEAAKIPRTNYESINLFRQRMEYMKKRNSQS